MITEVAFAYHVTNVQQHFENRERTLRKIKKTWTELKMSMNVVNFSYDGPMESLNGGSFNVNNSVAE